jgi:hypothetical protein
MRTPTETTTTPADDTSIARHNAEIHGNLVHWRRKPLLREPYSAFLPGDRRATHRLPLVKVIDRGLRCAGALVASRMPVVLVVMEKPACRT